jgi:hypothetical protein
MFPYAVVYFVVHKLRTMTPNSSDTRAHIAHSVRFHLFHVIRHRRKQSRRRNSITEKKLENNVHTHDYFYAPTRHHHRSEPFHSFVSGDTKIHKI